MPTTCAVEGCSKKYIKNNREISLFSFPREEYYIKEWQKVCKNKNINPKHARICSIHFRPDNFKEKSYAELVLNTTSRCTRKLRKHAIPTENLINAPKNAAFDSVLSTASTGESVGNYTFANGSTATVNFVTKNSAATRKPVADAIPPKNLPKTLEKTTVKIEMNTESATEGSETTKIDIDLTPTEGSKNVIFAEIPTAENLMGALENTNFNSNINIKSETEGTEATEIGIDLTPTEDSKNLIFAEITTAENLMGALENTNFNSNINIKSEPEGTEATEIDIDLTPRENFFVKLENTTIKTEINTDSATEGTINYTFANGSTAIVNFATEDIATPRKPRVDTIPRKNLFTTLENIIIKTEINTESETEGTETTEIDIDAVPTEDSENFIFSDIPRVENILGALENTTFNPKINFKSETEGTETTKIDIDVTPTENLFAKLDNTDFNSEINTASSTEDTKNGTFAENPTGTISTSESIGNNKSRDVLNTIDSKIQALEALISQPVSKEGREKNTECREEFWRRILEEINELQKEKVAESKRINEELKDQTEVYRLLWLEAKKSEAFWKKECQIHKMREEYAKSKLNKVSAESGAILNGLKKVFTSAQIKVLINPEKRARRNREVITGIISTRSLTSKVNLYLKKVLKIPLPGLSSLRCWINRCDVEPGVLKSIFKMIAKKGNKLNKSDKITVLTNYRKFRNLKRVHFFDDRVFL